jgi:hypothetical protein
MLAIQTLAEGKNVLVLERAKPLIKKRSPMQTRVRETGSGSLGSNGGCATMRASHAVAGLVSEACIASNENKISDVYRERAWIGGGMISSCKVWSEPRVGVRCIAWLDVLVTVAQDVNQRMSNAGRGHAARTGVRPRRLGGSSIPRRCLRTFGRTT